MIELKSSFKVGLNELQHKMLYKMSTTFSRYAEYTFESYNFIYNIPIA